MSFVHLHVHTEFSLLDGACRIRDLPGIVKAMGQTACAVTDHGVMYGAVDFYRACKAEGIKPIIGCEVYVTPPRLLRFASPRPTLPSLAPPRPPSPRLTFPRPAAPRLIAPHPASPRLA